MGVKQKTMKIKTEKSLLFWLVFFGLLSAALIVQSSFLPGEKSYSFIPYLTLPAIVFFFLHQDSLSSLCLLLFISFLSGAFSSLPVSSLFFVYFSYLFLVFFIKNLFFFRSSVLFFLLVFIFSFFFPYFVDLIYNFSIKDFSFSTNLAYFFKAIMTLALSFLLFPIFKKYLQENAGF